MSDIKVWSFGWALVLTSIASSLLVILKEKNSAVMDWMKAATGHHWITQGVIVLMLFAVLGFGLARIKHPSIDNNRLAVAIVISTIVSGSILALFFLFG